MMSRPLVSVICLCHNHSQFVSVAIQSVFDQTHPDVELIIVDDGSIDGSKNQIEKEITGQEISFINIENPLGNCKAFNLGLKKSSGSYIIDLAADDVLLPKRIEEGLKTFHTKKIGIEFCNVLNIDDEEHELGRHFSEKSYIPEGDIYVDLIKKYLISSPGMMIKREVLESLNGYDEELSYEDFDFWIRSSKQYHYGYTNKTLVKKRNIPGSLSKKQFKFLTKHQKSTLRVCQKIRALNQSKKENIALRNRCLYEVRQCLKQGNLNLIPKFLKLSI
ncbi:MAG: glycosyltransferase [Bacteroidota bacterium]